MSRADTRLALVLTLAVAVGCGGHSDSSSSASTAAGSSTQPGVGLHLPQPRAEHTATLLPNGDIFIAGGVDRAGNPMASTLIITQTAVIPGPDMATPRVGHSATFDINTNTVIIAGGHADAAGTAVDSSEVYDVPTGAILPGPTLAQARAYHATAVTPGPSGIRILLFGGEGTAVAPGQPTFLAGAEVLDVAAGTSTATTGSLNAAQARAHATLLDTGQLLVISGRGASGAVAPELYDTGAQTFTPVTATTPGGAAVYALGPREVLLAGGEDSTGPVDTSGIYDSASQAVAAGPALAEARSDASASRIDAGAVAVLGGKTATGVSGSVDVLVGSPPAFVSGPALFAPRWGHTATVRAGSDRIIVVGGHGANGVIDTIEEVDLAPLMAGNTPPVSIPPGAITSYPYTEDFDSGLGGWSNVTAGDDFDWTELVGPTTSSYTGPTGDHTSGSGTYVYTESSYPNDNGQVAILEGPVFAAFTTLEMRFHYHMWAGSSGGNPMGDLNLDVSTDDGATWDLAVWSRTGDQGNNWSLAVVDLSSYAGQVIKVRFRGQTASYQSDMAIDDVEVSDVPGPPPPNPNAPIAFPYDENLDSGWGLWRNATGDDFDWSLNQGTTTSSYTGPSGDHTTGTSSYAYTESSYPNDSGQIAILEGPTFGSFSTLELRFWYHMYSDPAGGLAMGSMNLDVSTDGGTTWDQGVWSMTGDQGNAWQEAVVDLSSYAGQDIKLRLRGQTASYQSDMAIDDIRVTGTP